MNKVPDRAQMRREYLLNTATLRTLKIFAFIAQFTCNLAAVFAAFMTVVLIIYIATGWSGLYTELAGSFTSTLALITIALLCKHAQREISKRDTSLVYIPPAPPVARLPAKETLLRGSQALPASPEELVRPAGSEETKPEELLRAASVGNGEVFSAK